MIELVEILFYNLCKSIRKLMTMTFRQFLKIVLVFRLFLTTTIEPLFFSREVFTLEWIDTRTIDGR